MSLLRNIGIAFLATVIFFFAIFIIILIASFSGGLLGSFFDCGSHNPDGCIATFWVGLFIIIFLSVFFIGLATLYDIEKKQERMK